MAKEKQAAEPRPEKINGHKAEQGSQTQAVAETALLAETAFHPGLAAGSGDPGAQSARLADRQLAAAQRQGLARQIGQQQGNGHLQHLLVSLQREAQPAQNGHARSRAPVSAAQAAPAAWEGLLEPADELDSADPEIVGASAAGSPASHPNGKNGKISENLIQRQSEAGENQEKKRPTEAEKAAARIAAKIAEAKAGQSSNQAVQETAKSRALQENELQNGQAARQKTETAKSEAASVNEQAANQTGGASLSGGIGKTASDQAAGSEKAAGGASAQAVGGPASAEEGAPTLVDEGALVDAGGSEKAPDAPEDDPTFQAVITSTKRAAGIEKSHASSQSKAREAQAAAEMPSTEVDARAEAGKMGQMEAAPNPGFDAAGFKARIMQRIADMAPKTMEETDDFKKSNKLGQVKSEMQGQATQEKDAAKGPMQQATEQPPDSASVPPKPVTPLDAEQPGQPASVTNPAAAVPKPKTQAELEEPLKADNQRIDQQLAEENVTDAQLAGSNEPEFLNALQTKQEAHAQAETGPGEYRQFEQAQIDQAQGEAVTVAQEKTQAMHGQRAAVLNQVTGHKSQTKSEDEKARAQVAADIEGIYNQTKTHVEAILAKLDQDVAKTFDEGSQAAKQAFEDYVDAKMDAYKEDRYGGWLGWADWLSDKISGMPNEVNVFYVDGRNLFLQKMDAVIDSVVALIGSGLTEAKAEIANGKKEIQKYLTTLPKNLQQVGQQAAENISGRFDGLEQSVDAKQDELIQSLASKYQDNLKAVDDRIDELKAENRGLVQKAVDFAVGVVNTIRKLKDMLLNVLSRIASVVMDIISAPIEFLRNFTSAVRQGLDNFTSNIVTHLKDALVNWITGTTGKIGIQIPDDIFSLEGIFSLVTQLTGLNWEYIRAKAVNLLGEPAVKALETSFDLFKLLITDGPLGLWKYVKEKFSDLKETVIDAIIDIVKNEVIQAGIKSIMSLLNPATALIKAAIAIYDIIKFFMEHGSQIIDLINAVIDSVQAVVSGSISTAAKMIENALAKALPLVIGMLANLLGIGDLADKVQAILKKIRDRIDAVIDALLLKVKKYAGKALAKTGIGTKGTAGKGGNKVEQLQIGLADIDKQEKKHDKDGLITHEGAVAVASEVEKRHPIFESLVVVKGKHTWDYEYTVQRAIKVGEEQEELHEIGGLRLSGEQILKMIRRVARKIYDDEAVKAGAEEMAASRRVVQSPDESGRKRILTKAPSGKIDYGVGMLSQVRYARERGKLGKGEQEIITTQYGPIGIESENAARIRHRPTFTFWDHGTQEE